MADFDAESLAYVIVDLVRDWASKEKRALPNEPFEISLRWNPYKQQLLFKVLPPDVPVIR